MQEETSSERSLSPIALASGIKEKWYPEFQSDDSGDDMTEIKIRADRAVMKLRLSDIKGSLTIVLFQISLPKLLNVLQKLAIFF